MSDTPLIYKLFRDCRNVAADNAIVAAIPHVAPDVQRRLVRILFAHASEEALAALPELYHLLNESVRPEVIANSALLFGSLRTTSRSSEIQTRFNSIEIVRKSLNPRLAYLAAVALNDGAVQIRTEAAAALRHLTQYHCRTHHETAAILQDVASHHGDNAVDRDIAQSIVQTLRMIRDERQHLLEALRDAILHFESHHRTEVIEAAMLLADELEQGLFHESTFKRGKITQAMMELFSEHFSPEMAPFVYVALCYPEPRRRVLAALAHARIGSQLGSSPATAFFAEFIRYHWLAREPKIRRGLATIRSIAWLADPMQAAFSLPADVAAHAPAWLVALGIPTDQKITLLQQFTLIDNPAANRAAVWAMVNLNVPAATIALQQMLDHEDPALRRIAERELDHRRRIEERIMPSRLNRPEGWTRLLYRAGVEETFEDLWNRFDQLDPREARSSGPCAMRYVSGFITQVQVKLISSHATDRLRAVRFVNALNVVNEFSRVLFNMANDPDAEVRSAAMTALGNIKDQTARRILERALADDDPSVQVAAIDALDEIGDRRRIELIAPRCDSKHAPVRAAAIRVLLRLQQPAGANEIIKMLHDPRPDHRCHALWIVDLLHLTPLRQRMVEMNHNDPDSRIARIAHHVVRRLSREPVGVVHPVINEVASSSDMATADFTQTSPADNRHSDQASRLDGQQP